MNIVFTSNSGGINETACYQEDIFIGIDFSRNESIEFNTERDEINGWNAIMMNAVGRITGKTYRRLYPYQTRKYLHCQNDVVMCRLDSYTEEYTGGGERTGTIELTFLFYSNLRSTAPLKTMSVRATGESDYGHSNPLGYAIEEACLQLIKKELGYNRVRAGFGPSIAFFHRNGIPAICINFEAGLSYARHYIGIPLSAALSFSDTLTTGISREIRSYRFYGIGGGYGFYALQTPYFSLLPRINAGYWHVDYSTRTGLPSGHVSTTGGGSEIYYSDVGTSSSPYDYFLFPGIEFRAGKDNKWARITLGAYIGLNRYPILTAQAGILFTQR